VRRDGPRPPGGDAVDVARVPSARRRRGPASSRPRRCLGVEAELRLGPGAVWV
jgi:hypothetical protein